MFTSILNLSHSAFQNWYCVMIIFVKDLEVYEMNKTTKYLVATLFLKNHQNLCKKNQQFQTQL